MPGDFPSGYENPYKASSLDPRVDGGKPPPHSSQPTSSLPTRSRDTALPASNTAASGSSAYGSTTPAPSTLTTTADPVSRSAEYTASTDTKGLDAARSTSTAATHSQPTPVATAQSHPAEQGIVGKTLGAIGLGGAATSAANYLGYGTHQDTAEPRDTSAVATHPGLSSQETGPPTHYRRESIPTTAYPGGPNSPRAIAPPIGGTTNTRQSIDQGLSGSAVGSGVSNERGIGGTPATVQGVSSSPTFGLGSNTSGVPDSQYSNTSRLRDEIGSGAAGHTGGSGSHTSRDLAAGGTAAAATGVAAHSLHHHERSDDLRSSAAGDAARQQPFGSRDETLAGGNSYTITGGRETAPVDAISSRDPNSTPVGLGSSTSSAAPIAAVAAAPGRYDDQDYSQSRSSGHTGLSGGAGGLGSTGINSGTEQGQNAAPYYDAITVAPGSGSARAALPGTYGTTSTGQIAPVGSTISAPSGGTTGYSTGDYSTSGRQVTGSEHTGRGAGLAAAGTAAAGGAAYAAHEHSNDRELEKEAAKREKTHEKEEKKHQKEIEKEEKKHDKEEREAAHAAEKREHARLAAEGEDRKRREREAAAGVGAAGVGTAAAGEHHEHKEKKPSLFKRIFKRRQNKDTGEEEEYSSDDEEDKARHGAAGSSVPIHHSEEKGRNVLGSSSGTTGAYGATTTSGLGESRGYGTTGAGTTGLTSTGADGRPIDSHTGLAYDPSKDPAAASRLSGQETGEYSSTGTGGHMLGSEPLGEIGDTRR